MFWYLFKDPFLNVSDRLRSGGAAHENPGHAATFLTKIWTPSPALSHTVSV